MIPTTETIARAKEILENIESLQAELASLFGGSAASGVTAGRRAVRGSAGVVAPAAGAGKKRKMTAEGRARIAAAAKARWAKFREEKEKKAAK